MSTSHLTLDKWGHHPVRLPLGYLSDGSALSQLQLVWFSRLGLRETSQPSTTVIEWFQQHLFARQRVLWDVQSEEGDIFTQPLWIVSDEKRNPKSSKTEEDFDFCVCLVDPEGHVDLLGLFAETAHTSESHRAPLLWHHSTVLDGQSNTPLPERLASWDWVQDSDHNVRVVTEHRVVALQNLASLLAILVGGLPVLEDIKSIFDTGEAYSRWKEIQSKSTGLERSSFADLFLLLTKGGHQLFRYQNVSWAFALDRDYYGFLPFSSSQFGSGPIRLIIVDTRTTPGQPHVVQFDTMLCSKYPDFSSQKPHKKLYLTLNSSGCLQWLRDHTVIGQLLTCEDCGADKRRVDCPTMRTHAEYRKSLLAANLKRHPEHPLWRTALAHETTFVTAEQWLCQQHDGWLHDHSQGTLTSLMFGVADDRLERFMSTYSVELQHVFRWCGWMEPGETENIYTWSRQVIGEGLLEADEWCVAPDFPVNLLFPSQKLIQSMEGRDYLHEQLSETDYVWMVQRYVHAITPVLQHLVSLLGGILPVVDSSSRQVCFQTKTKPKTFPQPHQYPCFVRIRPLYDVPKPDWRVVEILVRAITTLSLLGCDAIAQWLTHICVEFRQRQKKPTSPDLDFLKTLAQYEQYFRNTFTLPEQKDYRLEESGYVSIQPETDDSLLWAMHMDAVVGTGDFWSAQQKQFESKARDFEYKNHMQLGKMKASEAWELQLPGTPWIAAPQEDVVNTRIRDPGSKVAYEWLVATLIGLAAREMVPRPGDWTTRLTPYSFFILRNDGVQPWVDDGSYLRPLFQRALEALADTLWRLGHFDLWCSVAHLLHLKKSPDVAPSTIEFPVEVLLCAPLCTWVPPLIIPLNWKPALDANSSSSSSSSVIRLLGDEEKLEIWTADANGQQKQHWAWSGTAWLQPFDKTSTALDQFNKVMGIRFHDWFGRRKVIWSETHQQFRVHSAESWELCLLARLTNDATLAAKCFEATVPIPAHYS